MFLRWRKTRTVRSGYDFYYIRPELVESFREAGKVRQRVIKYLGSIREMWAKDHEWDWPEKQRVKFWETVNRKLDALKSEREDFTQQDVEAVKAQIAKRVDRVVYCVAKTPEGEKAIYM